MNKDKELYYLINYQLDAQTFKFQIIKKEHEDKVLKININENGETSCSCMDWRTRCRSQAIACKHIYYLLQTMIDYELFDYYDN